MPALHASAIHNRAATSIVLLAPKSVMAEENVHCERPLSPKSAKAAASWARANGVWKTSIFVSAA